MPTHHKKYVEHKLMLTEGLVACYWAIDKIQARLKRLDKEYKEKAGIRR